MLSKYLKRNFVKKSRTTGSIKYLAAMKYLSNTVQWETSEKILMKSGPSDMVLKFSTA